MEAPVESEAEALAQRIKQQLRRLLEHSSVLSLLFFEAFEPLPLAMKALSFTQSMDSVEFHPEMFIWTKTVCKQKLGMWCPVTSTSRMKPRG